MHRGSRGRPKCSLLVHSRDVISLMKPAFVWLGFRGPDCNVIAEQGAGPDARPSWGGSGARAGGCPTLNYIVNCCEINNSVELSVRQHNHILFS